MTIAMNGGEFMPDGYMLSEEMWDDLKDSAVSGMIASVCSIPFNYAAAMKSWDFLPLQILTNMVKFLYTIIIMNSN